MTIVSSPGYYFFAGTRAFGMIYLTHNYGDGARCHYRRRALLVWLVRRHQLSERLLNRGYVPARVDIPGVALLLAIILIGSATWISDAYVGTALHTVKAAAPSGPIHQAMPSALDFVPSRLWRCGEAGRMALR